MKLYKNRYYIAVYDVDPKTKEPKCCLTIVPNLNALALYFKIHPDYKELRKLKDRVYRSLNINLNKNLISINEKDYKIY